MLSVRLGLGLAARLWGSPIGLLLAAILLLTGPLLTFLAPVGPIHDELGGGQNLLGLAVMAGAAIAIAGLGRREAFLELLPTAPRLTVQAVSVLASGFGAAVGTAAGAWAFAHWSIPVGSAALASVRMTGLALPLLALRLQGPSRLAVFLALTWWVPSLALSPIGWQGHVACALSPTGPLSPSESPSIGTMLAPTLLGAAVLLTGVATARSVSRIR